MTPCGVVELIIRYSDAIMGTMASQITSLIIVYSTVCSGADQRKHQSSASLTFVWGIHRWSVNSQHKGPVTRKMFPFDDVIMNCLSTGLSPLGDCICCLSETVSASEWSLHALPCTLHRVYRWYVNHIYISICIYEDEFNHVVLT